MASYRTLPNPGNWARSDAELDEQIRGGQETGQYVSAKQQKTAFGEELQRRRQASRYDNLVTFALACGVDPLKVWELENGYQPGWPLTREELVAMCAEIGLAASLWENEPYCR